MTEKELIAKRKLKPPEPPETDPRILEQQN